MASSSNTGGSGGMSVEDQMRDEIARLTATIDRHKSGQSTESANYSAHTGGGYGYSRGRGRGRGGGTGPHKQYVRPGLVNSGGKGKENAGVDAGATAANVSGEKVKGGRKEVIIGGVAFEASRRSLVRKDVAATKPKVEKQSFTRKGPRGRLAAHARMYKPQGRNMTLDNTTRTHSHFQAARKIDKACSRFTKTGTCSRGLTCPYQHDAAKTAVCWAFMQGDCPKTADTCNLSHHPTPERTPLCVHFLNRGRCTKQNCLFPHVNVGKKDGVCKDFAVLGYCAKGVECDRNHVRECPEFEETGQCRSRGCKLPHVIKANTLRTKPDELPQKMTQPTPDAAQLGDEYISLIFDESEDSESDEAESDDDNESSA